MYIHNTYLFFIFIFILKIAKGLEKLTTDIIAQGFQVSSSNPLVGLEGRSNLLKKLATVLTNQDTYFKRGDSIRPGHLVGNTIILSSIYYTKY